MAAPSLRERAWSASLAGRRHPGYLTPWAGFAGRQIPAFHCGRQRGRPANRRVSGTTVCGDARYRWEGRLTSWCSKSPQLDACAPSPASAASSMSSCTGQPRANSSRWRTGRWTGWRGAGPMPFIRASAGQLITASRTYRDVCWTWSSGGRFEIAVARCDDDGLNLSLRGVENTDAAEGRCGVIGADSAQAIAPLATYSAPDAFRRRDAHRPWLRPPGRVCVARLHPKLMISFWASTRGASVKLRRSVRWRRGRLAPGRRSPALVEGANGAPAALLRRAAAAPAQSCPDAASSKASGCFRARASRRWFRWMPTA